MAELNKNPFEHENFIPEGLEYKEDYWYGALSKIERYERGIFWKKAAWMSAAACTLGAIVTAAVFHFRTPSNSTVAANVQPQEVVAPATTPAASSVQDSAAAANNHLSVSANTIPTNTSGDQRGASADSPVASPTEARPKTERTTNRAQRTAPSQHVAQHSSSQGLDNTSLVSQDLTQRNYSPEFSPKVPAVEGIADSIDVALPTSNSSAFNSIFGVSAGNDASADKISVSPITLLGLALDNDRATLAPAVARLTFDPIKKWNVYAAVGSSFITAYATQRNNIGFDPYARVGFTYRLAPQWRVSSGLELTTISNITASYGNIQRTYDFSYRNTITKVNTDALYLLTLPVTVERNISPQVQVSAGAGMSYLFAGTNTLHVSEETSKGMQAVSSTQQNGYIRGFRTIQPFVSAAVAYTPRKKWSIGLGYQLGLTDVTLNNYYTQSVYDRNSRWMIELKRFIR